MYIYGRYCGRKINKKRVKISNLDCELIIDQLVGFLVVEPAHLGSSPRLGTGARTFLDLFQNLTALCFSMVGDVPVDSETPVVTS
jgi:hypothetical protein